MRTAYLIDDELQALAASVAGWGGRPALRSVLVDGARVECLWAEGRYQVERCTVPAGYVIPQHTHPHADTIEVGVSGAVRLTVNGSDPFAHVPDGRLARFTRGRGIRINACDRHGGAALGPAVFLSVQRWTGAPRSVLTDYRGEPLGSDHQGML